MVLQSILFSKEYYTKEDAEHWLYRHRYHDTIDTDRPHKRFWHARQAPPNGSRYYVKHIGDGIIFVFYE